MKTQFATLMAVGMLSTVVNAQEMTADEIARELANPANPMSSIGNNLEYKSYKGDLPGAGNQESLTYLLQPSFPFDLGEGRTFALRPAIPVFIQQPVYDAASGKFTDESGLGDISFDSFLGRTRPSGWITMYGVFGVLPTASEDTLGKDQWMLGPELVIGKVNEWGVLATLISHSWDVAGEDDFNTSLTSIQYIYTFNLGSGYQLASGPAITYDWEAESDQAWTVPLGVGLAKTVILGKLPIKMQLQGFYNVEAPDAFAQDWGAKLSITPVVANPFVR
jgi:hypothetical protein